MTTSISRRSTQLFRERYELPPAWGVTQKCPPGGISLRGDLSPEGVTGPAGVRCQGTRASAARARVGLGAVGGAELAQAWVTCFLTIRAPPGRAVR